MIIKIHVNNILEGLINCKEHINLNNISWDYNISHITANKVWGKRAYRNIKRNVELFLIKYPDVIHTDTTGSKHEYCHKKIKHYFIFINKCFLKKL